MKNPKHVAAGNNAAAARIDQLPLRFSAQAALHHIAGTPMITRVKRNLPSDGDQEEEGGGGGGGGDDQASPGELPLLPSAAATQATNPLLPEVQQPGLPIRSTSQSRTAATKVTRALVLPLLPSTAATQATLPLLPEVRDQQPGLDVDEHSLHPKPAGRKKNASPVKFTRSSSRQ